MIRLSVDADVPGDVSLMGKSVTDLQTGIEISDGKVTGTSKWVTGYNGYSQSEELQSGNFLALHATADDPGATISVDMIGGFSEPRVLDPDGLVVFRIESNAQGIRYAASKAGKVTDVKTFSLEDLTLTPETPTVELADADTNEDSAYSEEELRVLTKAQLLELAETLRVTGVSATDTKNVIIAAILAAQEG